MAQLEYRLPRLTRMWTHLARQAGGRAGGASGGVGLRGPGETQLEVDRREIGRRISHIKGASGFGPCIVNIIAPSDSKPSCR
ncbi:MAG: hypothetical protein R3C44_04905 [Chloroflexota bacterium]